MSFDRLNHLNSLDRGKKHPEVEPRDAASLIVIDRRAAPYRFLMGQRNKAQAFMPDVFVFPGGAVEAADCAAASSFSEAVTALSMAAAGGLNFHALREQPAATAPSPASLYACALREMAEETGLCPDVADEEGVRAGHLLARAITPPGRRMRYDTRFFVSEITEDLCCLRQADEEFSVLKWVDFETAVAELPLHVMTRVILEDLNDYLQQAQSALPLSAQPPGFVPFYRFESGEFERHVIEMPTPS